NYELQATRTGQVDELPGSRRVHQLLLEELRTRKRPGTMSELQTELGRLQIPTDKSSPAVKVLDESNGPPVRLQHIEFESEPGITLKAKLYIPPSPGRKPAVLLVADDMSGKRIQKTSAVAERIGEGGLNGPEPE